MGKRATERARELLDDIANSVTDLRLAIGAGQPVYGFDVLQLTEIRDQISGVAANVEERP